MLKHQSMYILKFNLYFLLGSFYDIATFDCPYQQTWIVYSHYTVAWRVAVNSFIEACNEYDHATEADLVTVVELPRL